MEDDPKEQIRHEWRSGRAPYQKAVTLSRKKLLTVLREHPNCSADEFESFANWSISGIPEKYIKKYKDEQGIWRYRALTLDELLEKERLKDEKIRLANQ